MWNVAIPSSANPAIKRLLVHVLDSTTTGIGLYLSFCLYIPSFSWKFPFVYEFTVRLFIQGMQLFEIKAGTMEVGLLTDYCVQQIYHLRFFFDVHCKTRCFHSPVMYSLLVCIWRDGLIFFGPLFRTHAHASCIFTFNWIQRCKIQSTRWWMNMNIKYLCFTVLSFSFFPISHPL